MWGIFADIIRRCRPVGNRYVASGLALPKGEILPTKPPTGTESLSAASMMMNTSESEGLGLSVLLYLGAIVGALALLAVPTYYATRAEVHANPPLARADPLLNGPIIGDRLTGRFPLAMLQRQTLVDAETVALLKPKAKKSEPTRVAARQAHRATGTPMAELQTERSRPAMFPFNLF
ncbi:MAG: hypothetical protein PSV22_13405 [Pseudolabrys sp.]|nr:hypothetical protein [Pseudolabrys sp.]